MHEERALLLLLLLLLLFCIKRALGVENKMELHATFSFGDCTCSQVK